MSAIEILLGLQPRLDVSADANCLSSLSDTTRILCRRAATAQLEMALAPASRNPRRVIDTAAFRSDGRLDTHQNTGRLRTPKRLTG